MSLASGAEFARCPGVRFCELTDDESARVTCLRFHPANVQVNPPAMMSKCGESVSARGLYEQPATALARIAADGNV